MVTSSKGGGRRGELCGGVLGDVDGECLLYLPISSTLEDGSLTPSDNCTVAVMVTLPGFRARILTEIKSVLWYSMPAGQIEKRRTKKRDRNVYQCK